MSSAKRSSEAAPERRGEPCLSVRHLKTYFPLDEGTVKAVDDVSFDVYAGRTLAIVGESGCGKSVTVRSVLLIVDPPGRIVEGRILWRRDGEEVDLATLHPRGREIRRIRGKEISLIFQEPMTSFSPVHTVGNQLVETIRLHQDIGKAAALRRAIDVLAQVGIPQPESRVHYYPHQLSGGLRQRALIAMALACRPRLLIADEPTTALDVTTQAQILELLADLQRQSNMAVIFITHDLGVVAQVADDVAVMYLGRMVELGPVDTVFHAPKHPYTRALLRSIPRVNLDRRQRLDSIEGVIPHPFDRPPGCPFHTRCPSFMGGVCDRREPRLAPLAPGHDVSCFLYEGGERK